MLTEVRFSPRFVGFAGTAHKAGRGAAEVRTAVPGMRAGVSQNMRFTVVINYGALPNSFWFVPFLLPVNKGSKANRPLTLFVFREEKL